MSRPGGRARTIAAWAAIAVVAATGSSAGVALGAATATITGIVTSDGVPVEDLCVSAQDPVIDDTVAFDQTDSAGGYVLDGLTAGPYRVHFYDCGFIAAYVAEWYDERGHWLEADEVVVGDGETVVLHEDVAAGGYISGRVTDEDGNGVHHACVGAYDKGSETYGVWGETDVDGDYTIGGLATGTYGVMASDCAFEKDLAYLWHQDGVSLAASDDVAVLAPQETSLIDIEMPPAGSLQGTVHDGNGQPLDDVCVNVYEATSGWHVSNAISRESGDWTFAGLPTGQFRVHFRDCADESRPLAEEWFDDALDQASAESIPVTGGQVTGDIDAVLTEEVASPPPQPTPPDAIDMDTKSLTLEAKRRKVRKGKPVALTAGISPCTQGDVVHLLKRQKVMASAVADESCTARFRIKMRKAATFSALSPHEGGEAVSNPVRVKVRKPKR